MNSDVKVTVCDSQNIGLALEWFYQELPEWHRFDQIETSRREFDPANVLVASQRGHIRGVLITQLGAGRVAWLWPPALGKDAGISASRSLISHALIRAGVSKLAEAGARLTQVLLPLESDEASVLEANGFVRLTEMIRMERGLVTADLALVEPNCVEFLPYGPRLASDLQSLVERTYLGSMDCPELDGLRPAEEVLEGYRACGSFRPDHWLLARCDGEYVGCLLLAYRPDMKDCELQYMGVVPDARGRRIGRVLCDRAIGQATKMGAEKICVSVDIRNDAAINHYKGSGFVEADRRIVFVLHMCGASNGGAV